MRDFDLAKRLIESKDYRAALADLYAAKKSADKKYSYRKFSEDLGLGPTNHLHLVLSGKRNLSIALAEKISATLPWPLDAREFFVVLVKRDLAKSNAEKLACDKSLKAIANRRKTLLNSDQYAYFSSWFLPVIRELLSLPRAVSNLNWIAKNLLPNVDETEVKKALTVLERLGLILRKSGKWLVTEEHVSTPDHFASELIENYHREMLELAQSTLKRNESERDLFAMTVTVSRRQYEIIRQKLAAVREEITREIQSSSEPHELVAQLNMQWFWVSNSTKS